jgi:IS30 family transposase
MKHKQLTFEQRYSIEHMLKEKYSKKSNIITIGIVESTFYLQLKRKSKKQVYYVHHENILAEERRKLGHYKTVLTS